MTRRLIAPAPALRFCFKCGRELVRFVTVVREPGPESPMFESYQKPLLTPYCAYQSAHDRGEEVR